MHETLVERSGNVTLATLTKLLGEMLRVYYTQNMDTVDQATMRRAVRGYRKFVNLIRDGDVHGATDHWQATMNYTIGSRDPLASVTIAVGD